MKLTALIVLLLAFNTIAFCQNSYLVKGKVTDTMATYKLVNTSVSIMNEKDSTLVKYSRTDEEGNFVIPNLKAGKFILLLTYPGYADYTEHFHLDPIQPLKDFGSIDLILKSTLLKGVIIKGKAAAIKIKGDTTEFNAGSYVIEPNSKVEDLLKQLPGITIDKDGKITAQGQTVNKVLVDGEEFFGDDPTLVTKNIRGDMVDKVQLFDKKSDQATFTGIDDGEKTKTINIQLKEDKKNGHFGKIDLSAGTGKYYQGQAMFNHFKGKQRISAYGILGNTGKVGLGWEDNSKYGSIGNMGISADGEVGVFISGSGDDLDSFDGRYKGEGIPNTGTGGFHYEDKWAKDKHALNTNYKIGSISVEGTKNNQSLNIIPEGKLFEMSDQNFDNIMFRQKLDATYNMVLDSTSTLKLMVDGTLKNSKTRDNFESLSRGNTNNLLNTGTRDLDNESNQQELHVSLFWAKKMKKKGRTLSVNFRESINRTDAEGYLSSTNTYYNKLTADLIDSVVKVDQLKTNNVRNNVINTTVNYTEAISQTLSLALNYGLGINNSKSDRRSFNKTGTDQYNSLDPRFSNNFKLNQSSNQASAFLTYKQPKISLNAGTGITHVDFRQFDLYTNNTYKRSFVNWNPRGRLQYKLGPQEGVSVNYNGNTTQPNIDQIQPIRENTDPLNIRLGNPELIPSFTSNITLSYEMYKVLTEQFTWLLASYGTTTNPITTNTVTDANTGRSTYQSFNLRDTIQSNYSFGLGTDRKINSIDVQIGLEIGVSANKNYNMINSVINGNTTNNYNGSLSLSRYREKKYSFHISGGPRYSDIKSSLQTGPTNRGWGFDANGQASLTLPGKVELDTDGNFQYTAKTEAFDEDFQRLIWNAAISKKFFKQENLKASISCNDLLNQNLGFSRYASANRQSQNSYTTIKRYFLFSLVWDFNKMGSNSK